MRNQEENRDAKLERAPKGFTFWGPLFLLFIGILR